MKNNRGKKEVALVASGIVLGAALAAPVAGAALMAQQSSQKIVVDGKPVQIEAYSIGGSNYCKLRDVGKAVGFNVVYDPITNTVSIRTDEPYAEDAPTKSSRVVSLPAHGSQYVPQVGDVILCDDGTEYEIKDVVRWDTNVLRLLRTSIQNNQHCKSNRFQACRIIKHGVCRKGHHNEFFI